MITTNRIRLTIRNEPGYGASSSIGRALVCGTSGYGFEPREAPLRNILETGRRRLLITSVIDNYPFDASSVLESLSCRMVEDETRDVASATSLVNF